MMRRISTLAWLAAVVLVASCSSPPPPPPPTVLNLEFAAADDVNPDGVGRASPVVVRVFQLAQTGIFEKADFFQLQDKEAALLGTDLVARDELRLAPGASSKLDFEAKAGTKFLGVIGVFRDIDKAVWRVDVPVPQNVTSKFKINLVKTTLSIAPGG